MESVNVFSTVTREQAKDYCFQVLYRFNVITQYLLENPKERLGNTLGDVADQMEMRDFCGNLRALYSTDVLDNLSSEGYKDLLLKCKTLSDNYHLKVRIPADIRVIGEDIIEDFISSLTKRAIESFDYNIEDLKRVERVLTSQAKHINLRKKESDMNELELAIIRRKEYIEGVMSRPDLYQRQNGYEVGTKEYGDIQAQLDAIEQIKKDNPLIAFLSGRTDCNSVTKEIEKAVKTISNAQKKLRKKLIAGTFPVWELDNLVVSELNKSEYTESKQILEEWIKEKKKNKAILDAVMTLVPMGLSLILFFIPGGASLLLLGLRAGLQIANAGMSVASGIYDFNEGLLELTKANADIQLSSTQIDILQAQGKDAATFQFFVTAISLGFVVFDINDAQKALKLYEKADNIGPVARSRLRQCERMGERQLKECSEEGLRFVGSLEKEENALYIYKNMGNNVIEALGKSSRKEFLRANLDSLNGEEIYTALNFFPNKLNANIIWLGTDGVEAKKVLSCGKAVREQYNDTVRALNEDLDLLVDFSKPAKEVEENVNKIIPEIVRNHKLKFADESEHIALLRESLPPSELEKTRIYMRVQTNNGWSTVAGPGKEFAWVTDPLMVNFEQGIPDELMDAVGFTKDYASGFKDKVYADFIIFKDEKTAQKFVNSNEIIGWDKILNDFYNKFDAEIAEAYKKAGDKINPNPKDFNTLRRTYGDLITSDGKFNRKLFEEKYYKYYAEEHVYGTKYSGKMEELLGDKIEKTTGASYLFEGGGVTVEENGGLKSIERPLYKNTDGIDFGYDANKMNETDYMKVFRYEVTSDTSKPIRIVEIGADKKK